MSDFLTVMAESSRERAHQARAVAGEYRARLDSVGRPREITQAPSGFDLIAEAKLASPALGRMAPSGNDTVTVVRMAEAFAKGGAAVISVLTEPDRFDGSLEHLRAVAGAVTAPVMRKDFLVDPAQVLEARLFGASGVLLIARLLGSGPLVEMVEVSGELGMFCLVEVFDETDLEVASVVFDREVLIGVNARNLADLSVDRNRLVRLAPLLPPHLITVAESGVNRHDGAAEAARLGYRMALVGTALSTVPDPEALVSRLITSGRDAVAEVAT